MPSATAQQSTQDVHEALATWIKRVVHGEDRLAGMVGTSRKRQFAAQNILGRYYESTPLLRTLCEQSAKTRGRADTEASRLYALRDALVIVKRLKAEETADKEQSRSQQNELRAAAA